MLLTEFRIILYDKKMKFLWLCTSLPKDQKHYKFHFFSWGFTYCYTFMKLLNQLIKKLKGSLCKSRNKT